MTVMTLSSQQRQDIARTLAELRRTIAKTSLALATPQPLIVVMEYARALHALTGRLMAMGLEVEDLVPFVTDPAEDAGLDDERVMRILDIAPPDIGDLP